MPATSTILLNGKIKIVAMLGIGMMLTLSGCQKEADEEGFPSLAATQEAQSVTHLCYHMDDAVYHVTTSNDAELTDLMCYLCDQARQGHRILVYDEDQVSAITSKEKVIYETKTETEVINWGDDMMKQGYQVEYAFDKERGVYIGTATK